MYTWVFNAFKRSLSITNAINSFSKQGCRKLSEVKGLQAHRKCIFILGGYRLYTINSAKIAPAPVHMDTLVQRPCPLVRECPLVRG